MRGLRRYIWRFKPAKVLVAVFLLTVVLLNWSFISHEGVGSRERKQLHKDMPYEWLQKLTQKGFQFSKIGKNNDTVTIIFTKKEGEIIDGKKNKELLVKYRNNSKPLNSDKRKVDIQSELRKFFGNSQSDFKIDSNRENEANVDLNPPTDDIQNCPNNSLGHVVMTSYGSCKPHQPALEGCREASREYYYDPKECKHPFQGDICTTNVYVDNDVKVLQARCNGTLCREGKDLFSIKTLNHEYGTHEFAGKYSTIKQLEENLPSVLKTSHDNKYNYVFLQCKGKDDGWMSQLLPVDPRYTLLENKQTQRPRNLLNINIVLIDSVARDHFYRSLPKTIQTFKSLATNPSSSSARVFDFELFQAVEGHTAENTHALFTGALFPPNITRDTVRPVGMEKLFGKFKHAGYQTMWQEDLCWEGRWGLFIDLALSYEWDALAPKLKEVYIDHTGITHSSCEVLQTYGVISPFAKPSDKICYNGKYQHSYFLDYIRDNLQAITSNKNALPLLSYTALNVAHDMYGRRVQTMDRDLSRFVESMSKESNTLTIILADHGNTYTSYTMTQEGKFEMFHPSLFIIVPEDVGKLLGTKALQALNINQRRLVTMIDLHQSLMALAEPIPPKGVGPRGVFAPISSTRTCDDVELRTPNMCVCEGWDSPSTNSTLRLAFAEFAIGELNNKLTHQGSGLPILKSCDRLQPIIYKNVRVRNTPNNGGSLVTSMDIVLHSGDVAKHQEDIFNIEIQSKQSTGKTSLDLKLVHYERLSPFGVYSACADKGVSGKLCICSKSKGKATESLKDIVIKTSRHFQGKLIVKPIDESCLYLIQRIHGNDDASAFEVANTCTNQSHTVMLTISDVYNMKTSRDGPIDVVVPPGSVIFVLSAMKNMSEYNGSINVKAVVVR